MDKIFDNIIFNSQYFFMFQFIFNIAKVYYIEVIKDKSTLHRRYSYGNSHRKADISYQQTLKYQVFIILIPPSLSYSLLRYITRSKIIRKIQNFPSIILGIFSLAIQPILCERKSLSTDLQIGAHFIDLQYILKIRQMEIKAQASFEDERNMINFLCSLTEHDYNSEVQFEFNSFIGQALFYKCSTANTTIDSTQQTKPLVLSQKAQKQSTSSTATTKMSQTNKDFQNQDSKNQQTGKIKKIKKSKKPTISQQVQRQPIRDQNNCKCYHKIVKNYLIEQGLEKMIQQHEDKYHTRYYFIIALILIKGYIKSDFAQIYHKKVEEQLQSKYRKIQKKQKEMLRIEKKIEQSQQLGLTISNLMKLKQKLRLQIQHIKIVVFEIGRYSVDACNMFFTGNTEEALRILYLKNDPVMRKKYYFQDALSLIRDFEWEVNQKISNPQS